MQGEKKLKRRYIQFWFCMFCSLGFLLDSFFFSFIFLVSKWSQKENFNLRLEI